MLDDLDGQIQAFRERSSEALVQRTEALDIIVAVIQHLRRIPYATTAIPLLLQSSWLLTAHHEARSSAMDVLDWQDELDSGLAVPPRFVVAIHARVSLQTWSEVSEAWGKDKAERAAALSKLSEFEIDEG